MYVLQISKHSPESCPVYNEQTRGATVAILQNIESLLVKHGVKLVGMWNDHGAHEVYQVYDTPSLDVFTAFSTEPEMISWLGFNTIETKVVLGPDEIRGMFGLA